MGLAGMESTSKPVVTQWLMAMDFEANGGAGEATWTIVPTRAMTFPDMKSAYDYWSQVSIYVPVRPTDGQPNRPLTMYTVEIKEIPNVE